MCRADGKEDVLVPAAALCTLGSVTVPSLASVFNEFAMKKHMDTSVHEQVGLCQFLLKGIGSTSLTPSQRSNSAKYDPSSARC